MNILSTIAKIAIFTLFLSAIATGCQDSIEDNSRDLSTKYSYYMRFTDNPIDKDTPNEKIYCDAESQTVTLRLHSMTEPGVPLPTELRYEIIHLEMLGNGTPYQPEHATSQPENFYRIWSDSKEGEIPEIKVSLDHNDTGKDRQIVIRIISDQGYDPENYRWIAGLVYIIQRPNSENKEILRSKQDTKTKRIPLI